MKRNIKGQFVKIYFLKPRLCKCGCENLTSGKADHKKYPKYILGHNRKGKKVSYKSRPSMIRRIVWNKNKKGF